MVVPTLHLSVNCRKRKMTTRTTAKHQELEKQFVKLGLVEQQHVISKLLLQEQLVAEPNDRNRKCWSSSKKNSWPSSRKNSLTTWLGKSSSGRTTHEAVVWGRRVDWHSQRRSHGDQRSNSRVLEHHWGFTSGPGISEERQNSKYGFLGRGW